MQWRSSVKASAGIAAVLGLGTALLAPRARAGAAETGTIVSGPVVTRDVDLSPLPPAAVRRSPSGPVREVPRVIGKPSPVRRLPEAVVPVASPLPSAGGFCSCS